VYTVREFRANLKEALDRADLNEVVELERDGVVYRLSRKTPKETDDRDSRIPDRRPRWT